MFWCFSSERFNGYFHTNNKAVEIQFMRKIMTSKFCDSFSEFLQANNEFQFYDVFFKEADSQEKYTVTDVIQFLKLSESGNCFFFWEYFHICYCTKGV